MEDYVITFYKYTEQGVARPTAELQIKACDHGSAELVASSICYGITANWSYEITMVSL